MRIRGQRLGQGRAPEEVVPGREGCLQELPHGQKHLQGWDRPLGALRRGGPRLCWPPRMRDEGQTGMVPGPRPLRKSLSDLSPAH